MDEVKVYPKREQRISDFTLVSAEGECIRISDYRGHRNLVLAFVDGPGCKSCQQFLREMGQSYPDIEEEEAQVIAIASGSTEDARRIKQEDKLPFPVLADGDGRVHRAAGAVAEDRQPNMTIYVTDRFGEIYSIYRTSEGHPVPSSQEILDWLSFIEIQCPECGVPEWPTL